MFKIYGSYTPMFIKPILAAEEMELTYEVTKIDLMAGEQKNPIHLARNPFGKIPVLEHNGKFLFESNTIMRYMADVSNSSFYPKESYQRAIVDQWMDYFSIQAGRWCTSIWFQKCIAPKFFNAPTDDKIVTESTTSLMEVMPIIDLHLAKNQWLTGSSISLADINAYMLMRGFSDAALNLSNYQHFMRWFTDYSKRPAIQRVQKWM